MYKRWRPHNEMMKKYARALSFASKNGFLTEAEVRYEGGNRDETIFGLQLIHTIKEPLEEA